MRRLCVAAASLGLALGLLIIPFSAAPQPAQCGRTAPGASGAATTLVVAGVAGSIIHLCGWDVTATAASTFQIITGTGATCGTGTINITAAHVMTGQNTINTSAATPGRYSAPVGNSICMVVTGTGPVQWTIYYTQLF
jgi:hypothetical protein